MKIGRGRVYYWDTSVFLHWLSDPVKEKNVIDAIEQIVQASERNEAVIITSTITRIEVLRHKMDTATAEKFDALFPHAVEWVSVTPPIARIAHEIRNYYHSQNPPKKIKTPDCIHLASAIGTPADEMHALDEDDLLVLTENVLGGKYKLKIIKPTIVLPPLLAAAEQATADQAIDAAKKQEEPPADTAGLRRDVQGAPADSHET